jgi:hypothetical protein
MLRNHVKADNVIREFGDFVAHREKDRGRLRDYINIVKKGLETGELPQNIPIANKHIQENMNAALRSLAFPELSEELANQFTICVISLLQSVQVQIKDREKITPLKLHVGVGRDKIWLIGEAFNPQGHLFYFPIMFGQNKYIPDVDYDYPPMKMEQVVEAISVNKVFRLVPQPISA